MKRLISLRRGLSATAEATATSDGDGGSATSAAMSPRVAKLLEEIVLLNMLEVKELSSGLKSRLGLPDTMAAGMPMGMAPGMMMMPGVAAGGAPAAAEAAAEPVAEKTHFNIKLEKFDAAKKIALIKEIRAITQLGLKDAKALVDAAPKMVKEDVAKEDAEKIRDKLVELGATIVLE